MNYWGQADGDDEGHVRLLFIFCSYLPKVFDEDCHQDNDFNTHKEKMKEKFACFSYVVSYTKKMKNILKTLMMRSKMISSFKETHPLSIFCHLLSDIKLDGS